MSKLFVQVERAEDLIGRADNYFAQPKTEPKPQINADRIRSMTVEELAIFCEDGCPPGAPICNSVEMIEGETMKEHCQRCWLSWLKSPADKDGGT